MMQLITQWVPLLSGIVLAAVFSFVIPDDLFRPGLLALGESTDETLMYVVTPNAPVDLQVPAGADAVFLHVVAAVRTDAEGEQDASRSYDFGVDALLLDAMPDVQAATPPRTQWSVAMQSRISVSPPDDEGGARRGVHLSRLDRVGTDARGVVLPISTYSSTDTVLRVRAQPGPFSELLVRAFVRWPRSLDLTAALDGAASSELPMRVRALGTALGEADIPDTALQRLQEHGTLRLNAVGAYQTTRVVLTNYRRRPEPVAKTPEAPLLVAPHRDVAFNVSGPVWYEIAGPPGTVLSVTDGIGRRDDLTRLVTVGLDGLVSVAFDGRDPRTIAFGLHQWPPGWPVNLDDVAMTQGAGRFEGVPIEVRTDGAGLEGQIAPADRMSEVGEDTFALRPDVRRARYYRLHPETPISFLLAPEQPPLRLSLRRADHEPLSDDAPMTIHYVVEADDGGSEAQRVSVSAPSSRFERWGRGALSSEPRFVEIAAPKSGGRVWVFGASNLFVRADVEDLEVDHETLTPDYASVALAGQVFRYAPKELQRFQGLRPLNAAEMQQAERSDMLHSQVRIDSNRYRYRRYRYRRFDVKSQRVLRASGAVLRHRMLMTYAARDDVSEGVSLLAPEAEVAVPPGGKEGELTVIAPLLALGRPVNVYVDDVLHATVTPALAAQRFPLPLSGGEHRVRLEGAPGVRAYLDAPTARGHTLRRRSFEQLRPGEALDYEFDVADGDRQQVLLQVLSMDGAPWKLRYRARELDEHGQPLYDAERLRASFGTIRRAVRFYDRMDAAEGSWSATRVRFSPRRAVRNRALSLSLPEDAEAPVWVRAVLLEGVDRVEETRLRVSREEVE